MPPPPPRPASRLDPPHKGEGNGPIPPRHLRIPRAAPGLAVGLFGGSFNPPHQGHLLVAETALKRLRLDQLWWMVTPGNPLKSGGPAPLAERLCLSEGLASDPRIRVTGFEARHRLRYTADTLALLRRRNPGVRFVWIMGADNLGQFHLWQRWREIARHFPIAVIDRPGATMASLAAPAARALARFRIGERDAARLAWTDPPAWVFLHGPRSTLSSTLLRAAESPSD